MDKKEWEIVITHDDSGEVVKILEYRSQRLMEKAYRGLVRQGDLLNYSACRIGPVDGITTTLDNKGE